MDTESILALIFMNGGFSRQCPNAGIALRERLYRDDGEYSPLEYRLRKIVEESLLNYVDIAYTKYRGIDYPSGVLWISQRQIMIYVPDKYRGMGIAAMMVKKVSGVLDTIPSLVYDDDEGLRRLFSPFCERLVNKTPIKEFL